MLVRFFGAISVLTIFSQAGDFTKLHDMCEIVNNQKCPNVAAEIKILQKFLNIENSKKIKVTGKWNSETKNAVIEFQKKNKLPATGYVGALTKKELDLRLKKRLSKIVSKNDTKNTQKPVNVNKKNGSDKIKTASKNAVKKITSDIKNIKSYEEFKRKVNLRKSYAVYKNPKLLKVAGRAKTILKVDISEQRVKLVVNGKVALSAPCTTGSKHKLEPNTKTYRDKRTPLGTFKIIEKIATKRSTIFGNIYRKGKLIYHGDRRKYRGSWKGVKFVGAPLYNWMRLTSSGIGLHASSHVKRYPGSNGCIRLPKNVSKMLFSKLKKGTVVKIVN